MLARPITVAPEAVNDASMPGSHRTTSAAPDIKSLGRGLALAASKLMVTVVTTSAVDVGCDATSSCMTCRATAGAFGSIRPWV